MIDSIRGWWHTRVQKDLSSAMMVIAAVDFTPYSDDIGDFFHWKHWHSVLHLMGAVGVYWRARQISPPKDC